MRIVAVSVVRNEADIVELFVRYHLQIVDHMIVANHGSVDDTGTILSELREEGMPVEVVVEAGAAFDQAAVMTRLMRRAVLEFGADWVLPLDCDEFLTDDCADDVRCHFHDLTESEAYHVGWQSYVPTPEDPQHEPNLLRRVTHRRRCEVRPKKGKIIVPRALALRRGLSLSVGNHRLIRRRAWKIDTIRGEIAPHLRLAHFPVRSPRQLVSKVLAGWTSRLASHEHEAHHNWHLKQLVERLHRNPEICPEELGELGFSLILFPGSVTRTVTRAARETLDELRNTGTTMGRLDEMATFDEVNRVVGLTEADEFERAITDAESDGS